MGHQLEDFYRTRKLQIKEGPPKKPQQPQTSGKKPEGQSHPNTNKPRWQKPERKEGNPEKQTRAEALKGIPKEIVDDRAKEGDCLKCGKPNHRWFECWAKGPTTTIALPPMSVFHLCRAQKYVVVYISAL